MINFKLVFYAIGLIFIAFALTLILPAVLAWYYQDQHFNMFVAIALVSLAIGGIIWYFFKGKHTNKSISLKEGFLLVVVIWVVFLLLSSIPFMTMQHPLSIATAIFESSSALTTTGATAINGLEKLAPSILYYRQQMQWFGGMGLIILAIAILPILGMGAMQLYQVEITGPIKDEKISSSIAQTAKILWGIYLGVTLICIIAYYLAGMSFFDAVVHSFSTVSLGGMSPYDNNFDHFKNQNAVQWVAIIFMVISAMNYSLHFMALSKKSLSSYYQNTEWRVFIYILLLVIVVSTIYLTKENQHQGISLYNAIRLGAFRAVSYFTNAGFTTDSNSLWSPSIVAILFLVSFIGGCSGSTSGGIKVIRFIAFVKSGFRQVFLSIYPDAVSRVSIGNRLIENKVIFYIWGFISLYILCFIAIFISMLLLGLNLETSLSVTASTINNLGPALGSAVNNYSTLPDLAKLILAFSMLLGRLEILGVVVLFSRHFWR